TPRRSRKPSRRSPRASSTTTSSRISTRRCGRRPSRSPTPQERHPDMTTVKNGIDRVLTWVCVVLFAALVLDVMWQVVTRQILNNPSAWSEELAKYLFIWLGLFGAALVFGERGHVAVDLLVQRSPRKVQVVLMVLTQLAI